MKTSRISRDTERILRKFSSSNPTKTSHDIGRTPARRVTRSSTSWTLSVANKSGSLSEKNSISGSNSGAGDGVGSESLSQQQQQQQQQQQPLRRLSARVKGYSYQADSSEENGSTVGNGVASMSDTSISKKRKRRSTMSQDGTSTKVTTAAKVKDEINTNATATKTPYQVNRPPRKAKRQPAKRILGADRSILRVDPPARWEEMYALTEQMRNRILAPVDTMGCESLAEEKRSPRDKRFQTLVALMLSSQTKDTVTAVAMRNLQEYLPGVRRIF